MRNPWFHVCSSRKWTRNSPKKKGWQRQALTVFYHHVNDVERRPAHSKQSHHCHHHDHSSLLLPRPTSKHGVGWLCLSKRVRVIANALLLEPTSLRHTFSKCWWIHFLRLFVGRLSAFPHLYSLHTVHIPVISAQPESRTLQRLQTHSKHVFNLPNKPADRGRNWRGEEFYSQQGG